MSIALSTTRSLDQLFKKPIQISSQFNRFNANIEPQFGSNQTRTSILRFKEAHKFPAILSKNLGLSVSRNHGFLAKAESAGNGPESEAEMANRGESSMPERFRHLTKEAPDKPVRWPFFIVLAFFLYTWRTVLWELSHYSWILTPIYPIINFIVYIAKIVVAIFMYSLTHPIYVCTRFFEATINTILSFHSWVISTAPIQELTKMVILSSLVFSIAEAAVPDSVNNQPYVLTVAGAIGFLAARGYISELFFWTLLLGLFGFGRWIKKRDYVSSALPVSAVLAAVGAPWIQMLVLVSYLSLAIVQHSKEHRDGKEDRAITGVKKVPFPLLCAALAIGVRLAAKWAGYRHLTWMIV